MRRYRCMAVLMMAANLCFAEAEVYLSIRADGKDGAGTVADPFDAGTQAQFDRRFASFGPNTAIHLGPGTYHTKGAVSFAVTHLRNDPRDGGWRHHIPESQTRSPLKRENSGLRTDASCYRRNSKLLASKRVFDIIGVCSKLR